MIFTKDLISVPETKSRNYLDDIHADILKTFEISKHIKYKISHPKRVKLDSTYGYRFFIYTGNLLQSMMLTMAVDNGCNRMSYIELEGIIMERLSLVLDFLSNTQIKTLLEMKSVNGVLSKAFQIGREAKLSEEKIHLTINQLLTKNTISSLKI